jgi:hypothetical protein
MVLMLPQPARQDYEGNPEALGFRLSGRSGLAPWARLATYGGWTTQLDDVRPWCLRGGSTRSANRTLKDLQRSAPSSDFLCSEAEGIGFTLRGSFFNSSLLPARTH